MLTHRTWHSLKYASVLLLLLSTGCTRLLFPAKPLSEIRMTMQVTPISQPGTYAIAGNADLPDRTQITVAALRYLYPGNTASAALNPDPTYSILSYQTTQVQQGHWQTQLDLWQVATNGNYQESWQLDQPDLGLALKPAKDVVFIATLTPIEKLPRLEQQLARQQQRLARGIIRSTAGQRYAQVEQRLALALPTGSSLLPATHPEEVNYGWGYRYLIPYEPQNPYNLQFPASRQTNAPPQAGEFMR